jgi:hypothetical protein
VTYWRCTVLSAEAFESLVLRAFLPLMEQYDLAHETTRVSLPEFRVSLKGQRLRLSINYEIGSNVWCVIEALDSAGVKKDQAGVEYLLMERVKGFRKGPPPRSKDDLFEMLRGRAELLEANGRDVMSGDISVFPRLQQMDREYMARWNKWIDDADPSVAPPSDE